MKVSSLGALALTLALCVVPSLFAGAPPPQNRIQTGQTAPDFTLQDETGAQIKLSAARGKSPVVLVFYRGWW